MNKPKRECGSCMYWWKWNRPNDGRGLCDKFDGAGKAEHGKGCRAWKGRKYSRNDMKVRSIDET
jgi:hypothetical protein